MKKKFFTILIISALFVPIMALAQVKDIGTGAGSLLESAQGASGYKEATPTSFSSTIGLVINAALSFSGVIFMTLMVYAGYLWMTAKGDESRVEKAQAIIRASVIGIIITVGAFSITNFILPVILAETAN